VVNPNQGNKNRSEVRNPNVFLIGTRTKQGHPKTEKTKKQERAKREKPRNPKNNPIQKKQHKNT
jgi:hypothetical protein